MNFMFNLSGSNIPVIKEYDTDNGTNIVCGEVVGITDGKVVPAADADTVLGVSAEEHSGEHDTLNTRADGTKVRVIIAPDAVYFVKAKEYTAVSGTATTLTVPSEGLSVNVNEGYAVLVSKTGTSLNTDAVGTARKISGCTVSGEAAVLTLEEGGAAAEGDVYMLLPEIGGKMQLDEAGTGVCFYGNAACELICVCTDKKNGTIGVKLLNTIFA